MKRLIYLLPLIVLLILGYSFMKKEPSVETVEEIVTPSATTPLPVSPSSGLSPSPTVTVAKETLPSSFTIANFPFQSQAPMANWDQLHDEACEEAAVILTRYYLTRQKIDTALMEKEILKMIAFETGGSNKQKNLTVAETADLAKNYYPDDNLKTKITYDITINDLKTSVSQDNPVILPTAGRELGNPNFRQPGPVYHMVVLIGYDKNNFIVQDVGTRKGDHYKYSQQVLYNAIHDWNGNEGNIGSGRKAMIVVNR